MASQYNPAVVQASFVPENASKARASMRQHRPESGKSLARCARVRCEPRWCLHLDRIRLYNALFR